MKRLVVATAMVLSGVAFGSPASAGGGCRGQGASSGDGTTVELAMNCMNPRVVRTAGDSADITFVNRDEIKHNLMGDGWFVESLSASESVTRRFPRGTHVYSCTLHPGMVGAVVVGDGVGAANPVRVASVEAAARESSSDWALGGMVGLVAGIAGVSVFGRLRRKI